MYKKTEETYILNEKDKLIITYENGNIKVLVNNEIRINPSDIKLNVLHHGITSMVSGKQVKKIEALELKCEVGD